MGATGGDVSLSTVNNIFLNEGETEACALVSVDAGDFSLGRSGNQLTHSVSPECEPSLLQPWKTVHCTADNSVDVCGLSRVYGSHVDKENTSDSRNSTAC